LSASFHPDEVRNISSGQERRVTMRVLLGATCAAFLLSSNAAQAQDALCAPVNLIVESSSTYFSTIRGEAIEDLPLHRPTVPLPGSESCSIITDTNFGMYSCEFDVAADSDHVAESLVRRMYACLPSAQSLRRKTTGPGGWQFDVANLNISAGREAGTTDVLVYIMTR
jgi:hypothetical protein